MSHEVSRRSTVDVAEEHAGLAAASFDLHGVGLERLIAWNEARRLGCDVQRSGCRLLTQPLASLVLDEDRYEVAHASGIEAVPLVVDDLGHMRAFEGGESLCESVDHLFDRVRFVSITGGGNIVVVHE